MFLCADCGLAFVPLRLLLLTRDRLPLERRLLVDHAKRFGLTALKRTPSFGQLLEDIELDENRGTVPHPREVFARRWQKVAGRLLRRLGLAQATDSSPPPDTRRHAPPMASKALTARRCERCDRPLQLGMRSDARFCSDSCRVMASRARRCTKSVNLGRRLNPFTVRS
ncbi:MAG: hypothetical protein JWN44_7004 [Myxococcales bacterium]|nr:hypothetical protein [Myxococcales bacterium]